MIKKFTLDGITVRELNILPDERGFFAEIVRQDWKDFIDEWFVQSNLSFSYPGVVRAWHRHLRGQVDYFLVIKGALKICAYDDVTRKLVEVVNSSMRPSLVRIPGNYWHGTCAIGNEPAITVYFTTRLYDHSSPDEERRPWNDPAIVPLEINGNTGDPRAGKPYDWFYPPFK